MQIQTWRYGEMALLSVSFYGKPVFIRPFQAKHKLKISEQLHPVPVTKSYLLQLG